MFEHSTLVTRKKSLLGPFLTVYFDKSLINEF